MIRSGIICAGNWIVDLVHDVEHWPDESDLVRIGAQTRDIGGGAANVIAGLSKLDIGLPLWPMGAVGDDGYGAFVLDACRGLGLPVDQLVQKQDVPTAHTHVMSAAGKSRTFFYQGGANDALCADDFPLGTFKTTNARIFYLGYLTLLKELDRIGEDGKTEAARVLERAQKAGLITCVDLVSAQHPDFQNIVSAAAPFIDYLIVNEVEAARATGLEFDDPQSHTALAAFGDVLMTKGVCQAVIIHCVERAYWKGADGASHVVETQSLPPAEIQSPLGAGDAFCAGLLYAIHDAKDATTSLRIANAVARASLRGMTATSAIPTLVSLDIT